MQGACAHRPFRTAGVVPRRSFPSNSAMLSIDPLTRSDDGADGVEGGMVPLGCRMW